MNEVIIREYDMASAGVLNPYVDSGSSNITVSSTALSLLEDYATFNFTEEQVLAADAVHIRVATNPIRYRYSGEDATTSSGYKVAADAELELVGKQIIRKFSMIAEGSNAAVFITLLTYGIPPSP